MNFAISEEQKMIYDMISLYAEKQCKVNINVLLRFYERNKINLFHLLGDKLIYEVPSEKISLKMSKEIKARAVERAINAIEIDTIAIYNYFFPMIFIVSNLFVIKSNNRSSRK